MFISDNRWFWISLILVIPVFSNDTNDPPSNPVHIKTHNIHILEALSPPSSAISQQTVASAQPEGDASSVARLSLTEASSAHQNRRIMHT
jgi:hypothetical protein